MKNKIIALTLFIFLGYSGLLYSQTNIYLKLGDIKGEATDKDHKEWISVTGFEQGISLSAAMTGGGGGAGKARFSELKLTRKLDKATPLLMVKTATGAHMQEAILEMTAADGKLIYIIKLSDVVISGITNSTECNPACVAMEELKLSFGSINWEYKDKNGVSTKGGWDAKLNRAM